MSTTPFTRGVAAQVQMSFVLRRALLLIVSTAVVAGVLLLLVHHRGLLPDVAGVVLTTGVAVAIAVVLARRSTARDRNADLNALYRIVAQAIPDGGVFLFDRDLRYVLAEGESVNREELEGRTIWEALDPEAAAAIEPSFRAALAGERATFEMDFRGNSYRVSVAPSFDDHDRIAGGIVHSQQITGHKRLEEQLQQSQKLEAVGALAGGVAHDFNNVLTVITGYTSMLLDRASPDDEAGRESLGEIALAAERASALTEQLLSFSRRQVLHPQVLDVNDVVDALAPMLHALIEERIEIVCETRGELSPVLFDRGRLEQVIVNLTVNARDAIEGPGRIVIETAERELDDEYVASHPGAKAGRHVMLAVSDNGCGIDAETYAHIFEPFFTTKPAGSGTGLGLSTVHGIVQQSGGTIWVYSEVGRGTVFRVYLPVADEHTLSEPALPSRPLRTPAGETILLVEDDEAVLGLTRRVLTEAGYDVVVASTAEAAAELLAREPVDLVLSDLVLPGGAVAGLGTGGARTPIVYMSGYTEASALREGLIAEGDSFLEKPFTPDRLLAALSQAFE